MSAFRGPVATLTVTVLLAACTPSIPIYKEGPLVPAGTGPELFKVLTYNAWHGLDTGEFWVTPSESPEANEARLQFQATLIGRARPDIVFLQEVNPLPARAEQYVQALAALGLKYEEVHQVDACGIRVHGDTALIPGLNNGLVILARHELRLRKLQGLKLSGDLGHCGSGSGLQLEELRYAVIGDITMPETGQHYLVASTHLHSGIEAGSLFLDRLERAHAAGFLPRYPKFRWEVEQSRLRRIGELDVLARTLRELRRQGTYAGFAAGGDFNFESDFPEYREALLLKLTDAHELAARGRPHFTADPQQNRLIQATDDAHLPVELQKVFKELPPALAQSAREVYASELGRPRRIDYLWLESFFSGYCVRQELFGTETNQDGLPASDHFGVLTIFTKPGGACRPTQPTPP